MSTEPSSSSSRPLNRGAACLPCRKLKAKCDGNKPACGRCIANHRPDDCEYATGAEVTRSRLLEENIALLEARIRELENPGEVAPSVQLYDLGRQPAAPSTSRTQSHGPAIALYPAGMVQPAVHVPDPTPQEVQVLIQTFMLHAYQLGLFLTPARLRAQGSHVNAGSSALMSAVLLWGSRLSSSSTLRNREAYFADSATQAISATTMPTQAGSPGQDVLCTIQAEVLLANYFFATGRLLEGRYHCLAAVALITGSRFHQLDPSNLGRDPVAAGERIRAFWTVVNIDKAWAAAMNTPPSIAQFGRAAIRVTTPWPLPSEAYDQGIVVPRHGGNYSMEDYVRGAVDDSNEDFSPLAIRAKAAALYDRAIYVSSQYRVDMPNRNDFLNYFNSLDSKIERFHRQLVAVKDRRPDDMREVLVSRTFACAAAIQLHAVFSSTQPMSWKKTICVAVSASRALDIVDINQYPHLDPVIAILWSTICKVLITEMDRVKHGATPAQEDLAGVTLSLDKIMATMGVLSTTCPLMGTHLAEIHQARVPLN
ncbi:transcription factor [Ganoderma sinense ZZ0214-1]|uniref:Transcription factor n=1 Tax=Ganoderma sinense ZZ0214-1 TaxID=1077348 RepID=A0A2G8S133_9APHY|nr:transcription factor [Ganoderma sinense ZZ0214-1]